MAVLDEYKNSQGITDGRGLYASSVGITPTGSVWVSFTVAAADGDNSIIRFATVPSDTLIRSVKVANDAITLGTDYDLGIYTTGVGGAVKDADILFDGVDMSSARTTLTELYMSGTNAVDLPLAFQPVYLLAGDTEATKAATYDIAIIANTIGTAAGDIIISIETGNL